MQLSPTSFLLQFWVLISPSSYPYTSSCDSLTLVWTCELFYVPKLWRVKYSCNHSCGKTWPCKQYRLSMFLIFLFLMKESEGLIRTIHLFIICSEILASKKKCTLAMSVNWIIFIDAYTALGSWHVAWAAWWNWNLSLTLMLMPHSISHWFLSHRENS